MEEKEQKKVKLGTVLVIIAIVAIGLIIGVLYKQNIKQNIATNNSENAMIGEKTVSESEIKDLFQNFMNLFGKYQGSPYSVLYEMKKITGKNVINDEYPKEIKYNGEYVLPTNIKYSEFKEFMLNYMTEEFFNTDFSNGYVNKDGDLYCKNFGATGVDYEVKSIEKQENSENKYKAKVNMVYSDEDKEEVYILFEINNSEKCVISGITMPSENMNNNDKDNTENTISKDSTSEKEAQISNSNLIGKWEPAFAKKDNKDISLMDIYGSSIKLGGTMEFKSNNKYTAFIGAYSSEMEDDLQGGYLNGETSVTLIANSGKKKILSVTKIDGEIYLQEEKHDNGSIIMVYFKKIENTTNTSTTTSSNIEWENYPNDIDKQNEKWLGADVSDSVSYNLMKKTMYSLSKKNDKTFRDMYYSKLGIGDSTKIIEWTSNYSRYCYPDNKNNDLSAKYTKKITYDVAVFNEAYYDGYYDLTTSVKRQYEKLKNNKYYYEISKMLVMNGNNESQNDYKNNARAKKIKVIINKEKEFTFDLNDTNKVQIFDIGYKQNDIKTPVNLEVEVLEKYNGEKTNDVYVSDIQFGINSNIPQGR